MNKRKLFVFVTLALALLIGVVAAEAGDEKLPPSYPVNFTYEWRQTLEPGKFWVDETGTHIRGRLDLVRLKGGVEGVAYVVYNADMFGQSSPFQSEPVLPILPGDGQAYGTISIYETGQDRPAPTWSGSWDHKIENGQVVAGGLSALNYDRRWIMRITSITQSERQVLVHAGTIQYNCAARPCLADLAE